MKKISLSILMTLLLMSPSYADNFSFKKWFSEQKWAQDLDLVDKDQPLKLYTEEDTIDLLKDPVLVSEQLRKTAKIGNDRKIPAKIQKLPTHRVAIHISEDDPRKLKIALNNIKNLSNSFKKNGHLLIPEIVAYGPGIKLFHPKSQFSPRIQKMKRNIPFLQISACRNSLRNIYERDDVPLMTGVKRVGSGVIRLVQLQENGYSYIKP